MPNTITTSGIVYPVPTLTESGPLYATEVSNALVTISTHMHTGTGDGYQINIAGQLVQNDLSLQGFNLSNTKSVEFISQPAALTGSQDVNCVYVNQNNLGFNNNDGIFVPITSGNTLAIISLPFTNWTPRTGYLTSNFSILYTDTYNLLEIDSTGGPITGTLPIANTIVPVAAGRLYLFRDISGTAGLNNITIRVAVGSGNVFATGATSITINNNGGYVGIWTDGINTWYPFTQNMYNFESTSYLSGAIGLRQSSQLLVDNTSTVLISGGTLDVTGGLATFATASSVLIDTSTQVNVRNNSKFTWQSTSLQEHQSGSSDTYDAGSIITLNGTVNGTTTGGTLTFGSNVIFNNTTISNGTFNLPGLTNLNGTSVISGTGNSLIGTIQVSGTGGFNGSGHTTISWDQTSNITNLGTNVIGGMVATSVLLTSPTTYTCDSSGTQLDNYVGCVMGNSTSYTVKLPASPTIGRIITIGAANDVSAFSGFGLTVNGNGHNITSNGTPTSSKNLSFSATGVGSLTFLFINSQWITIADYNML